MIGTRLSHYEITNRLGSGGMGDVYQATDSKLGRSVAIKVLPDAFARDTDRVARLKREARVLASLNHPNIAAIYGLEESVGRTFLVMELVTGETLAQRIARGSLPVDEALAIAAQIATALEAAHEKGVVHRDLKPANIKVTPQGQVKVLDFGLAKAFAAEGGETDLSNSPTVSLVATNAGVILGTAAYMSPEQAKGSTVDHRTDVFALGSVLYEMLTGRRPFPGETVTEILAAVLRAEPDWSALPERTPAGIRRLLQRCLRKDRTRRLQTAGDARIEIEDARAEPDGSEQVVATARAGRRERLAWSLAGLFAAGVVAAAGVLYFRAPEQKPEIRVEITTPPTTSANSFAISPDGREVVFAASGDGGSRLWLRPLDASARPMAGTEGATLPFWKPDGRSIGFFSRSKLKRIDIDGSSVQTLADAPVGSGGSWSPEGVILFSSGVGSALRHVPASSGEAVTATKLDPPQQTSHSFPNFLPGGRQFLFRVQGTAPGIYLGSLDSPETKRLLADVTLAAYVPTGWLLFIRQGTLVAQRFDAARAELTGDPINVAQGVSGFSVSSSAAVAYRPGAAVTDRRLLTWFDRSGKPLGTMGAPDENGLANPEISPDGRRVAVDRTVQGDYDVWLIDTTRIIKSTFNAGVDMLSIWSPDGGRIVFSSNRNGNLDLYEKQASSGASSETLRVGSPQSEFATDWSPDGRFLLYNHSDPKTGADLWIAPLEGDGKPIEFLKTSYDERFGQFSPDGHWVAYQSNESGRNEIYVRPFPRRDGQFLVSTFGGAWARWRPDGKELYYVAPDEKLMAASVVSKGTTVEFGAPVPLFQMSYFGVTSSVRQQYDVASDGRFLVVTSEAVAAPPITLLLNWRPAK